MEFGLDKCAKATFPKKKLQTSENIDPEISATIKALEQHNVYKYLGMEEHDSILQRNITEA